MKALVSAVALALAAPAAASAGAPAPLFASEQPIHITIQAPMRQLVSKRDEQARSGTLAIAGTGEVYPVSLSPRGITRRSSEICEFPPLRVDFMQPPAATSQFAGQRRLKLVTHCRQSSDFQQKVLLEYAAYKMYNVLTPQSFRARLANVDYVDERGHPYVSRVGFFIEDFDDVARRNGMAKARAPDTIAVGKLDPAAAARFAVFNYMISNLDWSMRAGPAGEPCCHNGRLLAISATAPLVPVPYDFDYSGLVDAPYAVPPEGFHVSSVRERTYRGYCVHDAQARAAAADMLARRAQLTGVLATIPGLNERTQRRAASYLDGFFNDAASGRMFKTCVG